MKAYQIPLWGVLLVLCILQSLSWIWIYQTIRKYTSFFFNDNIEIPLLDSLFLSDLQTCSKPQPPGDRRLCSSPECGTSWPLGSSSSSSSSVCPSSDRVVIGKSHTSPRTCGWCGGAVDNVSAFGRYVQTLADQLEAKHKDECRNRIVVYSAALGSEHEQFLWDVPLPFDPVAQYGTKLDGPDVLQRHGNCFFTFVLRNNHHHHNSTVTTTKPNRTTDGIDWVIPIAANILPYRNHRRNTKLIKLQSHVIFPWALKLIWQDTKFRRQDFSHTRPYDYQQWFDDHVQGTCAGFYHLPSHANSFGRYASKDHYRVQFLHHCEAVAEALKIRRTVTDSMASLLHQCREYLLWDPQRPFVSFGSSSTSSSSTSSSDHHNVLSMVLIDSAFMGWDLREAHCRTFMADLTCTWLDELHCYSDRDQLSFPQAIRSMNLHPSSFVSSKSLKQQPANHRVELWTNQQNQPVAQFTKGQCHWYYQEMDECYHHHTKHDTGV
jgi:Protein of unknown function (DUF616)